MCLYKCRVQNALPLIGWLVSEQLKLSWCFTIFSRLQLLRSFTAIGLWLIIVKHITCLHAMEFYSIMKVQDEVSFPLFYLYPSYCQTMKTHIYRRNIRYTEDHKSSCKNCLRTARRIGIGKFKFQSWLGACQRVCWGQFL